VVQIVTRQILWEKFLLIPCYQYGFVLCQSGTILHSFKPSPAGRLYEQNCNNHQVIKVSMIPFAGIACCAASSQGQTIRYIRPRFLQTDNDRHCAVGD
jgi:hypothetical protein